MKNILIQLLEKYPDKPWHWYSISYNPNLTMEFIEKYPDKLWDWSGISCNPNITMDIIEKYPNKDWNWYKISENRNLTMEFIYKFHSKSWNWYAIWRNSNMSMDILNKYQQLEIHSNIVGTKHFKTEGIHLIWSGISNNYNLSMDIVEKYPGKPWDLSSISSNPNITVKFIDKNLGNTINKTMFSSTSSQQDAIRNVQWTQFSKNLFKKNKKVASQIIQKWYKNICKINNIILFIFYVDLLYQNKQISYITTYLKYNIVKYI
jgi:hypothetical protein